MRSSELVLLHLLLAVLLAFDGVGAAFAAAGPAPVMSHAAHVASEAPPPCHSTDADASADAAAPEQKSPAPDSCCDGGDCLCLHGCGSVLPVVPRIAASTGGTVVALLVTTDRAAPRLDDPVRPPILRT
ncbi:CopL family metal-binding regulatory protein [Luteimonas sp. SMYT11W]|uniref:CopL family metal-binding regulatory protein n=1 Tax=Luteimonas flava TaxID=3115822 RepID=A0ABU7WDH6_9GAMM